MKFKIGLFFEGMTRTFVKHTWAEAVAYFEELAATKPYEVLMLMNEWGSVLDKKIKINNKLELPT
jgi:hypothetical protein